MSIWLLLLYHPILTEIKKANSTATQFSSLPYIGLGEIFLEGWLHTAKSISKQSDSLTFLYRTVVLYRTVSIITVVSYQ